MPASKGGGEEPPPSLPLNVQSSAVFRSNVQVEWQLPWSPSFKFFQGYIGVAVHHAVNPNQHGKEVKKTSNGCYGLLRLNSSTGINWGCCTRFGLIMGTNGTRKEIIATHSNRCGERGYKWGDTPKVVGINSFRCVTLNIFIFSRISGEIKKHEKEGF